MQGDVMRTLRLVVAGMVTAALLAGLGGAVGAQEAEETDMSRTELAWATIRDEVFDVDEWEARLFELDPRDKKQARELRRIVRHDLRTLNGVPDHACYAAAHDAATDLAQLLDEGLTDIIRDRPERGARKLGQRSLGKLDKYRQARRRVDCSVGRAGGVAWATFRDAVFEPSEWQPRIHTLDFDDQEQVIELRDAVRAQSELIRELGSHPCYAEAHDWASGGAEMLDAALSEVLSGERVRGERRYWDAQGRINEYWSQREGANICGVSAETPAVDGAATLAWTAVRDEVFVDVDGWEGFLFELDPSDPERAKELRRLVRDQLAIVDGAPDYACYAAAREAASDFAEPLDEALTDIIEGRPERWEEQVFQFADNLYAYWRASAEVGCSIEDAASAVEGATLA
jgi:hypothetical protein